MWQIRRKGKDGGDLWNGDGDIPQFRVGVNGLKIKGSLWAEDLLPQVDGDVVSLFVDGNLQETWAYTKAAGWIQEVVFFHDEADNYRHLQREIPPMMITETDPAIIKALEQSKMDGIFFIPVELLVESLTGDQEDAFISEPEIDDSYRARILERCPSLVTRRAIETASGAELDAIGKSLYGLQRGRIKR